MADIIGTIALIQEQQRHVGIYLQRRMEDVPPAQNVLMIGPHPDDNLFGPGGTTIKYVAAGVPVHWLCVTDGRACVPGREDRQRLAEIRAREERECAGRLGLPEPELYGIPEDQLTSAERADEAVRRLRASIQRVQPDALFVPFFLETHPLHRYTTHLIAVALQQEQHACVIYSWAHGSLPPPSIVVDISDTFQQKRQLATCYSSQLGGRDWETELDRLGRFHASYALPRRDYCETFFAQDWCDFIADILSRGLDHPDTLSVGLQPMVAEEI